MCDRLSLPRHFIQSHGNFLEPNNAASADRPAQGVAYPWERVPPNYLRWSKAVLSHAFAMYVPEEFIFFFGHLRQVSFV